jgi:hypothetical protein
MDRVRNHEPGKSPDTDILNDVVNDVYSKLWWLEGWLKENLTDEQKERLRADYEGALG